MNYDDIKNSKNYEGSQLKKLIEWIKDRCVIETAAIDNEDAIKMLNDFLSKCDEIKCENIADQWEEYLRNYLKNLDAKKEEEINNKWSRNAENYIERVAGYRYIPDNNISKELINAASGINNDSLRFIYELIQNVDDCEYELNSKPKLKINFYKSKIVLEYNEKGMTYSDILAITTIAQSNKVLKKKFKKVIGEKGRGFKTVFSVCEKIDIYSKNYCFSLSDGKFDPVYLGDYYNEGTKMILHLKDTLVQNQNIFNDLREKYGFNIDKKEYEINNVFQNCPIFFTNKIDEIEMNKMLEDDSIEERLVIIRENKDTNILKVKYSYSDSINCTTNLEFLLKKYNKRIEFTYDEYKSRYNDIFEDEEEFNKAKESNIEVNSYDTILLFPLEAIVSKNEDKKKVDTNIIVSGNLFAYLPTYTFINAPISIQIPFELNKDRSCMWIEGLEGNGHNDNDLSGDKLTTKWNERLFNEVFISSEGNKSLISIAYEDNKDNIDNIDSIFPKYDVNNFNFFVKPHEKYDNNISVINKFCGSGRDNRIYNEFVKLKLFKKLLVENEYLCISDELFKFDEIISGIFEKYRDCIVKNDLLLNDIKKMISEDESFDVKDHLIHSSKIRIGISDIEYNTVNCYENFWNELIKLERDKVFERISCGDENLIKSIKIFKTIEEEQVSYNDSGLIIYNYSNIDGYKFNNNKKLFFLKNDDEVNMELMRKYANNKKFLDGSNLELSHKLINKLEAEDIEISYALFTEVIEFIKYEVKDSNNNWYEYIKSVINSDGSSDIKTSINYIINNNYEKWLSSKNISDEDKIIIYKLGAMCYDKKF